jgi:cytochrome c oxidase subunit 2
VLAIIFGLTLIALQAIVYPPSAPSTAVTNPNLINVRVTGHQWWWQFDYPDLKITTADEIHVPVDSVVMVTVESADVIHSFWVPQFGGKIDVIPGHTNSTWFKATQTGIFKGQCSEYCGEEHAEMAFNVVVDTAESYQTWVKQQQSMPAAMTGEAEKGEQLFMKRACAGCHTVQGSPAKGKVGPDLTHLASRSIFSGGVMKNTPENLKLWIANPPAVKPGVKMPNLGIQPEDINTIVTYLDALK